MTSVNHLMLTVSSSLTCLLYICFTAQVRAKLRDNVKSALRCFKARPTEGTTEEIVAEV